MGSAPSPGRSPTVTKPSRQRIGSARSGASRATGGNSMYGHGEGGVASRIGMASGSARTSVIFIASPPLALQIAQAVLGPALAHARLVLGRRPHGRREALVVPLGSPWEPPRARGVDEHAGPEAGADLVDVAVLERRAGIDRRAENAGEDDDAGRSPVHPVGEGPVHLLVRRGVDVLFDHDHVLVAEL